MSYSPIFRGKVASGVSELTGSIVLNNTGSVLAMLTPLRVNSSGVLSMINVSDESSMSVSGITASIIENNSTGTLAFNGVIKNITTAAAFGDIMYISKTGGLTNIKPNIGVNSFLENDFMIRIGVIAKNKDNPSNKDLHLSIGVEGQL